MDDNDANIDKDSNGSYCNDDCLWWIIFLARKFLLWSTWKELVVERKDVLISAELTLVSPRYNQLCRDTINFSVQLVATAVPVLKIANYSSTDEKLTT